MAVYSGTLTCDVQQTVASALLTRGHLKPGQIVHFTSLKLRTIRAAVIVLYQQNLLWCSSANEEKEVLEFNVDECLTRLRFGRYVWWAEKNCGSLVSSSIFRGLPPIERPQGRRNRSVSVGSQKTKAPDIYRLLRESTPNLCEQLV